MVFNQMDLNTVIVRGRPSDIMPIVRKLRKRGLLIGVDFTFSSVAVGVYEFWFKDSTWVELVEKYNTFLKLQ